MTKSINCVHNTEHDRAMRIAWCDTVKGISYRRNAGHRSKCKHHFLGKKIAYPKHMAQIRSIHYLVSYSESNETKIKLAAWYVFTFTYVCIREIQ